MIIQKEMIEKVKDLCKEDDRLVNAMMYGSFAKNGGDKYSDIEFAFFFEDKYMKSLDKKVWLSKIGEIEICYTNQFGIETVIFSNLVRGEFHFYKASEVSIVSSWISTDWFNNIDNTLIIDKNNKLKAHLEKLLNGPPKDYILSSLQDIIYSFFNWYIFGQNLLARGEDARALDILWWIQKDLLKLKRIEIESFDNYSTPSKKLEEDLTATEYNRYRSCSANLDKKNLKTAYLNSLSFFKKIVEGLQKDNDINIHENLIDKLKRFN
jgi:lincosamide nucleotidyltransferase